MAWQFNTKVDLKIIKTQTYKKDLLCVESEGKEFGVHHVT
jgi:hypothetical protein